MKRFTDALLLKGLWKFKPIHVVILWLFLIYYAWLASPYFMYHVMGAPVPGTAPRYLGTLRIEGQTQRTKTGVVPPQYFLNTAQGELEFHCGYRPVRRECIQWFGSHVGRTKSMYVGENFEIGYDQYWGLDYIRYSEKFPERQHLDIKSSVEFWRSADLERHANSAFSLLGICLIYAYLVWLAKQSIDEKSSSASDTTN